MPRLQALFVEHLRSILGDVVDVAEQVAPAWLLRPGRLELGEQWPLVQRVYGSLTGMVLPEVMPPRERRGLDVVLTYADGTCRAVEFDESQHFTDARARTLAAYNDGMPVCFDAAVWARLCEQRHGREPGGGFARPRPPLFPGEGGRHRQRAFRDFLADVVPPHHGWLPTVRISDVEVKPILSAVDATPRMRALWESKVSLGRLEPRRGA
ncbi:hypothetical protein DDP54_00820 (plasmid) [Cellulomonas sp. WB94]|uniref:hypothetical protein n=1 Tax=Cellulomonas sp. WB94 TaxID=2173174 RepID=UPI000D57771B|nr:hypothetical protein [Cellulomonas sp. WB94]PVU84424.1 hypothetical protein DDP54_00820 [Cellulomonas sp. WB94]